MSHASRIEAVFEPEPASSLAAASLQQDHVLSDAPVALLINIIMRHQQPQFSVARQHLPRMRCFLSAKNEPHRDYDPDFTSLDVSIQKCWTIRKKWRHAAFVDDLNVHLPYDTPAQLRGMRPRAILSYELGFRTLCAAMYRRVHRRCGLAIVVNESELTAHFRGLGRRVLRAAVLRVADIVTYNGNSCRRYLQDCMRVPEEKLRHVPYAAHPRMVYTGDTTRRTEKRHRLLMVGQLTDRKNPLVMLQCLAQWCKRNPQRSVEISIAGRGPLEEPIRQLPKPPNLKVDMLGSVPPDELPRVYSDHGILVFPTLADEWGLVVDEAMHSGLPVLASIYAQATLDLIDSTGSGWPFIPDSREDVSAALNRVLCTPASQIDAMAAAARQTVAGRTPQWAGRLLAEAAVAAMDRTR